MDIENGWILLEQIRNMTPEKSYKKSVLLLLYISVYLRKANSVYVIYVYGMKKELIGKVEASTLDNSQER